MLSKNNKQRRVILYRTKRQNRRTGIVEKKLLSTDHERDYGMIVANQNSARQCNLYRNSTIEEKKYILRLFFEKYTRNSTRYAGRDYWYCSLSNAIKVQ